MLPDSNPWRPGTTRRARRTRAAQSGCWKRLSCLNGRPGCPADAGTGRPDLAPAFTPDSPQGRDGIVRHRAVGGKRPWRGPALRRRIRRTPGRRSPGPARSRAGKQGFGSRHQGRRFFFPRDARPVRSRSAGRILLRVSWTLFLSALNRARQGAAPLRAVRRKSARGARPSAPSMSCGSRHADFLEHKRIPLRSVVAPAAINPPAGSSDGYSPVAVPLPLPPIFLLQVPGFVRFFTSSASQPQPDARRSSRRFPCRSSHSAPKEGASCAAWRTFASTGRGGRRAGAESGKRLSSWMTSTIPAGG